MYRTSDLRTFVILSTVANILAIAACALMIVYHFYDSKLVYRDLALAFLILSGIFKIQLFMYKVEIMEKRISVLVEPNLRGGKIAASTGMIALVIYATVFWVTLAAVLAGFFPATFWRQYFF